MPLVIEEEKKSQQMFHNGKVSYDTFDLYVILA